MRPIRYTISEMKNKMRKVVTEEVPTRSKFCTRPYTGFYPLCCPTFASYLLGSCTVVLAGLNHAPVSSSSLAAVSRPSEHFQQIPITPDICAAGGKGHTSRTQNE